MTNTMKTKTLQKTTALPTLQSILVERIRLTITRLVVLIFVVVCFFTSGTSARAQYSLLPRQCTDAYLEWYCFVLGQIAIGQPYVPNMPERLWFAQAMATQKLTPAEIQVMWNMPVFWATFKTDWLRLPEWQREALRRSWRLQYATAVAYGTQRGFASGTSNASPPYTVKSDSEAIQALAHHRAVSNQIQNIGTSMCNSTIDLMHAMSGH